jgi:16S rRNA (cytosine967-C5)-methyltransferase
MLWMQAKCHGCLGVVLGKYLLADGLDKPWAKKLVNAILRQIQRDKDKILTQTHYSHPTWLLKKIKQTYPDHFEQIFTQNNTQAPMTLRLHPQHNEGCQKPKTWLVH